MHPENLPTDLNMKYADVNMRMDPSISARSHTFKATMSNWIGFRLAVFIPLCTMILAACGGGNSQVQDAADLTPVAGEWVVVHELSDPEGLNPIVTNDASGQAIAMQVYEPLLEQNFTTLELQPVLAAEMPKISDDHLRYTFRLRDDITFSDGHPVTVDDVIFTLKIIKNPLVIDAAPNRNYYMDVADVVKHDKRSLTVVMAKPYFLADMQLGMLLVQPKHIQDPNNLTDRYSIAETNNLESAGINPAMKAAAEWYNKPEIKLEPRLNIGSGPYVYAERNPGESVILARNER